MGWVTEVWVRVYLHEQGYLGGRCVCKKPSLNEWQLSKALSSGLFSLLDVRVTLSQKFSYLYDSEEGSYKCIEFQELPEAYMFVYFLGLVRFMYFLILNKLFSRIECFISEEIVPWLWEELVYNAKNPLDISMGLPRITCTCIEQLAFLIET